MLLARAYGRDNLRTLILTKIEVKMLLGQICCRLTFRS